MSTCFKVLIIENIPAESRLIQELLKESRLMQLKFFNAVSLTAAVNIINKQAIDIILLDLGLADSQGIETFKTCNQAAYHIPIIILSTLEDESIAIATIAEGAQDYFVKGTFDGHMLARSMRYAIERKHHENIIREYAQTIMSLNEAVFSLSAEGMINSWNHAAECIYKYSASEIVGHSFLSLAPAEYQDDINRMLKAIKSGNSVTRYEIKLMNKSGVKIDTMIDASPIKNGMGTPIGVAVLAQDYTLQKLSELQVAIQLRIATILAESNHLSHATHSILKVVCEILDFQIGEVWIRDSEKHVLHPIANWSRYNTYLKLSQAREKMTFHLNEGIPGYIWKIKKNYWTSDLSKDVMNTRKTLFKKLGVNACFGFPIIFNDDVMGVFLLYSTHSEKPDIRFMIMFEVIGKQLGNFFKRKRMEKDLLYLAQHDALTGFSNKFYAEKTLRNAITNAKQHQTKVAFLYLDLDHFKHINDSLGYSKGDLVLQELSQRLQSITREADLVARFGGDEFAVILCGMDRKESIDAIATKIMQNIQRPFVLDKKEFYLTVSMGISIYPDDGNDPEQLFRSADMSMCNAKALGGNNYQYASPEQSEIYKKILNMEHNLHQALRKNEFVLYYQPIVNIQNNQIMSVEALVRWKNANGEIMLPTEFIPLIEQSSLILSFGEWVLQTACQQMKRWKQYGIPAVSVNISVKQFHAPLVTIIRNILQDTGLSPANLILEITESILMQRTNISTTLINSFDEAGVYIAIDDFGTGFSSFSYLKNFNVHYIKIDKSFIDELHTNKHCGTIIEAIIVMGHALNMKIIAEGVETKEQLDFLKEKGCDEYQGYYYSEPLPPDDLIKKLGFIKK